MTEKTLILAGVDVYHIQALREQIAQEANKFVSNGIDTVKATMGIIKPMLEDTDDADPNVDSELETQCTELLQLLKDIELVSDCSGMSYYLPWDGEYDETPFSCTFDDNAPGNLSTLFSELYNQLEGMESQSKAWNDSTC